VPFLLVTLASGFLLTYVLEEDLPALVRLAIAGPMGAAVSGLLILIVAPLLGLNPLSLALCSLLLLTCPLVVLRGRWYRIGHAEWRGPRRPRAPVFIHLSLLTILLCLFFQRVAYESPEGIGTGVWDNFADLAYHLGFIESFARADNFPPIHPMYAGARLTYPFLVNLHAAALQVSGLPLLSALFRQNLLLMVSLVGLLMAFTTRVTGSRIAGLFAPWLLLLNGGLGFLLLIPEVQERGGGVGRFLGDLPHDYSKWETVLHWGASLPYWFATMRGMVLAAPLMIAVWWFWWSAIGDTDPARRRRRLLAGGFLTGLLPLAHTHTFLCTLGMGLCLMLIGRRGLPHWGREWWVAWAGYMAVALSMALPQLFLLFSGSQTQTGKFVGLSIGWMAPEAERGPLIYWLMNAGLFLPLLLLALLWRRRRKGMIRPALLRFYLPFLLCFVAPNVVKFAPWAWDSVKVLYVWFVASVPVVALALARLWNARVTGSRAVAATAFVLLTLSGAVDVYRVVSGQPNLIIINRDEMAFAEKMSAVLPTRTVVVSAPIHNSPLLLTGRTAFMNYPGFLWTNGLPYEEREREVEVIYRGGAEAMAVLKKHGLHYLILGPQEERWASENRVSLAKEFYARFPVAAQYGDYRLYFMP
jgi:hypothetical protein